MRSPPQTPGDLPSDRTRRSFGDLPPVTHGAHGGLVSIGFDWSKWCPASSDSSRHRNADRPRRISRRTGRVHRSWSTGRSPRSSSLAPQREQAETDGSESVEIKRKKEEPAPSKWPNLISQDEVTNRPVKGHRQRLQRGHDSKVLEDNKALCESWNSEPLLPLFLASIKQCKRCMA